VDPTSTSDVVDLKTLRDGFTLAHNRFELEAQRDGGGIADAFFPLFEALNWAIAFSDRMEDEWPGASTGHRWFEDFPDFIHGPSPQAMRATRFVRNRVHHSWARAVQMAPRVPVDGHWDQRTVDWLWRDTGDIAGAGAGTREGEDEYDRFLSGQPVRNTLSLLEGLFGLALQELRLGTSSPVYRNARAGKRWTQQSTVCRQALRSCKKGA
jgi:hypothetical protein